MHIFGRTSLIGFLCGLSVLIIPIEKGHRSSWEAWVSFVLSCILHWITCTAISAFNLFKTRRHSWRIESHIILRSYFLGLGFSIGQLLVWKDVDPCFGSYLSILSFFHYSEFLVTSIISPSTLSLDSFLLNHSKEYGIAAAASWLEYAIELYAFPWLKSCQWPMKIGLFFCIAGELLRKGAMLTAWNNFTHLVREKRVEGHKLVTHGLYSLCRHPSYAGWFWWSIGTQVVLINPICVVGYSLASWKFFSSRILYEEATLLSFFGHKYFQYQHNVKSTGVPFVSGYILQEQLQQKDPQPHPLFSQQHQDPSQSQYQQIEHDNYDVDRDYLDNDNDSVVGGDSGSGIAAPQSTRRRRQVIEEKLNLNQFMHPRNLTTASNITTTTTKEDNENEKFVLNGEDNEDDDSIDDEVEEAIRLSATRKFQLNEHPHHRHHHHHHQSPNEDTNSSGRDKRENEELDVPES